MKIEKKYVIFIFLVLIITVVILSSPSPPPNPGHPASEIGSGTFSGDVNDVWSFPGKVGIGTASPTERLDVDGYVKGRGGLCIGNDCRSSWPGGGGGEVNGSGTVNYIPKWIASKTLGNSVIYQSGNNIGIGTTNPQAKLHVNGRIKAFDPVDDNDVATKGWVLGLVGGPSSWDCTLVNSPRKNDDTVTVSCPSGYKLITGGCTFETYSYYGSSYPQNNGWRCTLSKWPPEWKTAYAWCCR